MAGLAGRLARVLPDYARNAWWGLVGARSGPQPREVVQAVVLDAGRVLLSVRVDLRGWELPGGNPSPGEAPEPALVREVREETGIEVAAESLVGRYHRSGFMPHVASVYRCRPLGGVLRPSAETPRVRWWPVDDLPDTLFPWYRGPLEDALRGGSRPVERHERQGVAAVLAGMRIDLRMRFSDDDAA